jgi:lysophospholipase L1-like esterase
MDLKNCDESKTMPVSWVDIYYTNANIQKYSAIMEDVCAKNAVPFIEIGLLENSDFDDGLHPNTQGHQKIFGDVKSFLEKEKWI